MACLNWVHIYIRNGLCHTDSSVLDTDSQEKSQVNNQIPICPKVLLIRWKGTSTASAIASEDLCLERSTGWKLGCQSPNGLQPAHQAIRNQPPTSSAPACFLTAAKATCLGVESPQGGIFLVFHKLCSLKHSQFLDRHPVLKAPEN